MTEGAVIVSHEEAVDSFDRVVAELVAGVVTFGPLVEDVSAIIRGGTDPVLNKKRSSKS